MSSLILESYSSSNQSSITMERHMPDNLISASCWNNPINFILNTNEQWVIWWDEKVLQLCTWY